MSHEGSTRPPKVAIYDRPASADRSPRRWLPWVLAAVATVAWVIYLLLAR